MQKANEVKDITCYLQGECEGVSKEIQTQDPESWQQLAEAMTPSIVKVVEFAKGVPGFTEVGR